METVNQDHLYKIALNLVKILKSSPKSGRQKTSQTCKTAQRYDQRMRKAAVVSDQSREKDDQRQKHYTWKKVKRPYRCQAGVHNAADNNAETDYLEYGGTNSGAVDSEHNRQGRNAGLGIACRIAYVPHYFIGHDHGEHINKRLEEAPIRMYMRTQYGKNKQADRPSRARTKVFYYKHVFKTQMRLRGQEVTVIKIRRLLRFLKFKTNHLNEDLK